jgi:hypothetical protein
MHQDSFSIGFWLKGSGSAPSNTISLFARHNGDGTWDNDEEVFFVRSDGSIAFYGFFGANMETLATSIWDGEWHHLMGVWNYDEESEWGTGALYLDGVDITFWDGAWSPYPEGDAERQIEIGNFFFYDPFQGEMDDFMLIPYALTAEQVVGAMMGRIQRNDQIVSPGDPLRYTADITNTLLTQGANGFMVGAAD